MSRVNVQLWIFYRTNGAVKATLRLWRDARKQNKTNKINNNNNNTNSDESIFVSYATRETQSPPQPPGVAPLRREIRVETSDGDRRRRPDVVIAADRVPVVVFGFFHERIVGVASVASAVIGVGATGGGAARA